MWLHVISDSLIALAYLTIPLTLIYMGQRRKDIPFDDQTQLKVPDAAEVREYAARGVINDEEVGELSDIVQVMIAG